VPNNKITMQGDVYVTPLIFLWPGSGPHFLKSRVATVGSYLDLKNINPFISSMHEIMM